MGEDVLTDTARWVVRRLAGLGATLLVGSFAVYSSLYLVPGSPLAALSGGRSLSPAAREALEERYHLDDPFLTRYLSWLGGVLQGDLGQSILYRSSVADIIGQGLQSSIPLLVLALLLVSVLGLVSGVVAGLRPGPVDRALSTLMSIGLALPAFVAAPLLVAVFAVGLGWFSVISTSEGVPSLPSLVLPASALAISLTAFVGRVTRTAVRAENSTEHTEFARLRGMSGRRLTKDHVVRNSMIGISTVIGLTFASLIGAMVVVEVAFNLNGLGFFLIEAVNARDYPLIQGIMLLLFAVFVLLNSALDGLYARLDPRVSVSSGDRA